MSQYLVIRRSPTPRTRPQVLRREVERVAADAVRGSGNASGLPEEIHPDSSNRLSGCSLEQGCIISVIRLPSLPRPPIPAPHMLQITHKK